MADLTDSTTLFSGNNAQFLVTLYAQYVQDSTSVDPSWIRVFENLDDDARALLTEMHGASWARRPTSVLPEAFQPQVVNTQGASTTAQGEQAYHNVLDSTRASMLIRSYRVRGHLQANLDPLGLEKREYHADLDPKGYGFGPEDYDRQIFIGGDLGRQSGTINEIKEILDKTYADSIGAEFMHIQDPEQRDWIIEHMEDLEARSRLTKQDRLKIYSELTRADTFERFLNTKFTGAKRFGVEGAESTIPAIEQCLLEAGAHGVKEVVFGMAHRGRLNVLANIIGKPLSNIFTEFEGGHLGAEDVQGSGDVKYHLGCSSDRTFSNQEIHLSLTANPSHLEAVNPVVVGKVRAKQMQLHDDTRSTVMGFLLHGDAAFAGQGLVAETLMISELPGYRVGGTLHLVINNQIGFTTSPMHSRSSPYCSDVAKMVQAPIFHVNGDDPEAVAYASRLAIKFRQRFKKDVVIDLFCYRRHGHNEIDEPSFTQPKMYAKIADHPSTKDIYRKRLLEDDHATEAELTAIEQEYEKQLADEFTEAANRSEKTVDWLDGRWSGFEFGTEDNTDGETMVSTELLQQIGHTITNVPEGFTVHKRLQRILNDKAAKIDSGEGIDWATGEALAIGSLLCEGNFVRFSGQDCGRGTFSQRHAVFVDQQTEAKHIPLNNIQAGQAELEIIDSPLSEAAVLGFEYGYSLADPHGLVIWEAQFGDFANGAQVIIDQFLSSGEAKWNRMSGLVMLLPHAYEGQGPEHSSARLERYLQMSAERNWQVVNCTTPANYFHVLRRQMRRNIRKPLVVMTPKGLLRHKMAVSRLEDFGPGTEFKRVLPELKSAIRDNHNLRRVILCSGKIFYELWAERERQGIDDVAIVRLEQLYPIPSEHLVEALAPYRQSADVVWCQEEPQNMGSWHFLDRPLESILRKAGFERPRPKYVGRPSSASTATGYAKVHEEKQQQLVEHAFHVE
ncbi:MAG: 2-oxoglutarate dehydrogenase E1 component [Alphaproteobacteria bacterium]